jgi:hypothetical protein
MAMHTRGTIKLTNITRLPSGWGNDSIMQQHPNSEHICAASLIQQTGERKLLQYGTHILDAFTAPTMIIQEEL